MDALGGSRALRTGLLSDAVRRVIRDFAAKLPDMDGGEAALAEIKVRVFLQCLQKKHVGTCAKRGGQPQMWWVLLLVVKWCAETTSRGG